MCAHTLDELDWQSVIPPASRYSKRPSSVLSVKTHVLIDQISALLAHDQMEQASAHHRSSL